MTRNLFYLFILITLSACGSLRPSASTGSEKGEAPHFEHEVLDGAPVQEEVSIEEEVSKEENSISKKALEEFINDWYGTPHRMGGMTKKGVDCSGFVILAYERVFQRNFKGRRAEDLFGEMKALNLNELQYGDLVFFKVRGRRIDHVGIYVGELKFAHTSSSRGVMISSLNNVYWQKRFFKGGRYQP